MTTPRKTATEISTLIISQIESALNTTIPLFPKAFNRILAKVLGGVWVLLYQFAGFAVLQIFVRTASDEPVTLNGTTIIPLQEHGKAVNVFKGIGQTAEHTISITVLDQGGTLLSGTRIVNTATEQLYQIIGDVSLDSATVTATIRAIESGDFANVDEDQILSFISAMAAVEKDVVVLTRTRDGVDPETTEAYRQRVMDRYAARPQGGAYADYRDWGQSVEGVLRIYPYAGGTYYESGAGQVDVYVESSVDVDGIPSEALLTAVEESINLDTDGIAYRRPVNDYVNVLPITRIEYDVIINEGAFVDITATRAAIESALDSYFLSREPYILGLSTLPRLDIVSNAEVGGVVGRTAAAMGGYTASVLLKRSSLVVEAELLQEGEKAKLGSVSWT